MFGRDLGLDGEEYASEERFDKIRYYLKHSKYPNGADRAEKSRLRSAATHYKLVPETDEEPEKLMLKGKEVISEPQKQYEIARKIHREHHAGINKTTAVIAEKYHWVRIKETVNQVIRNCDDCKAQVARAAAMRGEGQAESPNGSRSKQEADNTSIPNQLSPSVQASGQQRYQVPMAQMTRHQDYEMPVDPRIMEGIEQYSYHQPQSKDSVTAHGPVFGSSSNTGSDQFYSTNVEHETPNETPSGSHRPLSADARIQQQLLDAGYGTL